MGFMVYQLGDYYRFFPKLCHKDSINSMQDSLAKTGCLVSSNYIVSYG